MWSAALATRLLSGDCVYAIVRSTPVVPLCRIIAVSFNNDKTFQNVLNHSFESFINLSQRSPEYISLFMDDKLRKGLKGMSEDDIEGVLDKVMMLFRYLQEKDVFEKYYKQHLAKRLLSGRTVSSWTIHLLMFILNRVAWQAALLADSRKNALCMAYI